MGIEPPSSLLEFEALLDALIPDPSIGKTGARIVYRTGTSSCLVYLEYGSKSSAPIGLDLVLFEKARQMRYIVEVASQLPRSPALVYRLTPDVAIAAMALSVRDEWKLRKEARKKALEKIRKEQDSRLSP